MWARLSLKSGYKFLSDKEIREAVNDENNTLARIEFLLRYFNSSWFNPFCDEERALAVCDKALQSLPEHNFFNYARAQFENDKNKKIKHLIQAATTCLPYEKSISAQAAYEASKCLYPQAGGGFRKCLAWFSKAIILGSEDASQNFINNDLCGATRPFDPITMSLVFLTTHLSGKKIPGLIKSKLLGDFSSSKNGDGMPCDASMLVQAYHYPNHSDILHRLDSPTRRIAEWVVMFRPKGFLTYFAYCFQNGIISQEIFQNLIHFYFTSNFTDKNDLREYAVSYLTELNLAHSFNYTATPKASPMFFVAAPQLDQTNYVTSLSSTPLATNYNSSYYYMYTEAPQIMSSQASQPLLVPEYRPAVTPTPYNSPTSTVTYDQGQQSAPQYYFGF